MLCKELTLILEDEQDFAKRRRGGGGASRVRGL